MPEETSTFVVRQTGERTIIAFRDWSSVRYRLYHLEEAYVADFRSECEKISATNRCKVLAIDMANVEVVPSLFLAVLVLLSTGGLQIELLNPSESLLELLETANLSRFFLCGDAESSAARSDKRANC